MLYFLIKQLMRVSQNFFAGIFIHLNIPTEKKLRLNIINTSWSIESIDLMIKISQIHFLFT